MAQGTNSEQEQNPQDPYSYLGINVGATFDEIKKARDSRLAEVGDDPIARAKIESSYDSLLMVSLRERQLGKASSAAINASQLEDRKADASGGNGNPSSLLTRFKVFSSTNTNTTSQQFLPDLSLPEGQGLFLRLALATFSILLVLVSPTGSIDLILSCSTIALFISQVRRGRRVIQSLGWSVVLLSIGLIVGGLLVNGTSGELIANTSLSLDQLEAVTALILIWLGTLLLA